MSNSIQIRRGTDAERVKTVFANGEPVWCVDTLQLWIGDGNTPGGRKINATDLPYARDAYSNRFNEQVVCSTVSEALDIVFQFINNVSNNIYYGDITSNGPIVDIVNFFAGLTLMQWAAGPKDIEYFSNVTYRVFAYPKGFGPLVDIQDPNFNYTTILGSYEASPREVTYNGTIFYVYITQEQCLSTSGKTIRYTI